VNVVCVGILACICLADSHPVYVLQWLKEIPTCWKKTNKKNASSCSSIAL